jgi:cellular nucleic acid-binding protein
LSTFIASTANFLKDWNGHKNSKKHREAEAKEKAKAEGIDTNGFCGDAADFTADTGDFTADTGAFNSGGDAFTTGSTTTTRDPWAYNGNDAGWGSTGFSTNAGNSYSNNKSGGGDRACFSCGQTGHQKRDCPQGGSGGGDRACFNCGELG